MPEIGQTVSHYRIIEKLGQGGMGEVFLAQDTSLDRKVALKFLPDIFSGDPERLARFEREAKLLASLNHPNIAAIYGLELADGKRFLSMELVEGETLAQQIERGPLPVAEALEVCRQIAEGLEAAHEKGVIHRDLKPANVKISPEEKVKILDFGLAKALQDEAAAVDASNSPTITGAMTGAGVLLGTAAYMSPEQARGQAVDKRTDIWAFGVVLFEMLTGRRAFDGASVSDTIAAVVLRDPDWSALPANLPTTMQHLLQRCIAKDRRKRLRDIADARLELEEAVAGLGSGATAAGVVTAGTPMPGRSRVWTALPWFIAAASLIALAAISAGFWTGRWSSLPAASPMTRLTITLPTGHTLTSAPAISRDGRIVAFAAAAASGVSRLFIRRLDEFESKAVPGTDGAAFPFFSPDGRSIAFFGKNRLQRWNLGGGAPQELAEAAEPLGGTWIDDGTIVFVPVWNRGLHKLDISTGKIEPVIQPDGKQDYAFVFPRFVPGRSEVVFTAWGNSDGVSRLNLTTGERSVRIPRGGSGTVTASGHLLFTQGDPALDLLAAPYLSGAVADSQPKVVLSGVHLDLWTPDLWLGISNTGNLAYVPGNIQRRSLAFVDYEGRMVSAKGQLGTYGGVAVSRVNGKIAADNDSKIWLYEPGGSGRIRLAPENRDKSEIQPVWAADGSRVYYGSNQSGKWGICARKPGVAKSDVILQSEFDQTPIAIAPDGTLAFVQTDPKTGYDIWLLPPAGKPTRWQATPAREGQCAFSPDGRWLAYSSDESARFEIYVRSVREENRTIQVSMDGGQEPEWSPKGDRLFYRQGTAMIAVDVAARDILVLGARRTLFTGGWDLPSSDKPFLKTFAVVPDGEHFVMIRHEPEAIPDRINIVLNWFEELKRLVPIGK